MVCFFFFLHLQDLQVTSIIKCPFFDSVMWEIVEIQLLLNRILFAFCLITKRRGVSPIQYSSASSSIIQKNIVH